MAVTSSRHHQRLNKRKSNEKCSLRLISLVVSIVPAVVPNAVKTDSSNSSLVWRLFVDQTELLSIICFRLTQTKKDQTE